MPVYTVHEPPLKTGETSANPERFVFVRDRFALFAFLVPPLWLVIKRLWLALVLYLLVSTMVAGILYFVGAPPSVRFWVMALISLLVGLEASTLQRWTLTRRKWKQIGTIVADNQEEAERRFFVRWSERRTTSPVIETQESQYASPVINPPRPDTLPLGLFPRPGASR
jgi:hypothetical protein